MDEVSFIMMLRFFWLDTSAIVKIFCDEPGSWEIRKVFNNKPNNIFYTSEFCVYEYYNVLKRKFLKDKVISEDNYLKLVFTLSMNIRLKTIKYIENDENPDVLFLQTKEVIQKYGFDYADAIQFILIRKGLLGSLAGESQPVLITSDNEMIAAANAENIKYWNPEKGPFIPE